jgi:hypothetical protein
MRRKKPIVLVSIIVVLCLTVIFINAEQDKQRRITTLSLKDIYSIKNNFPQQQRYVSGEIIVKFKMPLSDFEVAYLFGEFQPKIIGASRMLDGSYVIRFPENYSTAQMIQVFERNPYVKYAEPNVIVLIPEFPSEPNKSSLRKFHHIKRNTIKGVRRKGFHKNIEKMP